MANHPSRASIVLENNRARGDIVGYRGSNSHEYEVILRNNDAQGNVYEVLDAGADDVGDDPEADWKISNIFFRPLFAYCLGVFLGTVLGYQLYPLLTNDLRKD